MGIYAQTFVVSEGGPPIQIEKQISHILTRGFPSQLEQGCQMVSFQTKIPSWVNLGGPWNLKCWYILWPFGISYSRLAIFGAIRECCDNLEYFSPFWYIVPRKIWQL
jgi:hypothetical protein